MGFPDLPLDVWQSIIEDLSLDDLAAVYKVWSNSTSNGWVAIKRVAIKVITSLLAAGTPRFHPVFTDDALSFKLSLKNHQLGHRRHRGTALPCGVQYRAFFSHAIEYTRKFSPQPHDETTTKMTLLANNGSRFPKLRAGTNSSGPRDAIGPSELTSVTVDFTSQAIMPAFVALDFDTCSIDMENTFTDLSHSASNVIRTVAHSIPLRGARWVDVNGRSSQLPMEWFEFWASGIHVLSTFSRELVVLNLPGGDGGWRWKLVSFKTEWNLPVGLSSELLAPSSFDRSFK